MWEETKEKLSGEYEEPEEVVSWYVPQSDAQEVTDCYVQPTELPASVRPSASVSPKKSRKGLWIFLVILGVLLAVVIIATILGGDTAAPDELPEGNEDASSIIDIFSDDKTTIPRYHGDSDLRMEIEIERGEELTAAEVYDTVCPSTVLVVAEQDTIASVGTGVILSEDGYIITNAHVIAGGKSCWIALWNDYTMEAKLVGYDSEQDLAVLHVENEEGVKLYPAAFGDSERMYVGDKVYAIGNPLGIELRFTMTDGMISAINRDIKVDGHKITVLQTTAALNNGNSGGPLINSCGQVVGINTLKMGGKGSLAEATVEGLGFALPTSEITFVINDLIAYGEYRGAPTMGVTAMTVDTVDDSTAVMVLEVTEDGGAEAAGIQPGDAIMAVDGVEIYDTADLQAVRRAHNVGDVITLTLQRNGRNFDVELTLQAVK